MSFPRPILLAIPLVAACPLAEAQKVGWGGHTAAEVRVFPSDPLDDRQDHVEPSLVIQPEFSLEWEKPLRRATLTPFLRLDYQDHDRTHFDLRQLDLLWAQDRWDARLGVGRVYWGALEAAHLVDVINQTDLVENPDGEEKLGQPMVNFNYDTDFGRWSFFYLPFFRERTFPGADGRLRTNPRIVNDDPIYDSNLEEWHPDAALRWQKSIAGIDLGASYFYGTTREPAYQLDFRGTEPVLRPAYDLVHQVGLDLQWAVSDWLWKAEVMGRKGQNDSFARIGAGFEYTFYKIFGSEIDLGYINEFYYDTEGNNVLNPYERDLATGIRLAFNDQGSSTLLAAILTDVVDGSSVATLESTRRFGEHWTARIEGAAFISVPPDDFPLNGFRRDHYLQVGVEYHF